ncbi:MAG: MarR family winged helix-turn-helix transcriptional regulator [Pseudomonadota bacterium]|nr:MarR family winged helix-turn-helix transcriptional regulator [Pseudomonadota bacterium]
MEEKTSVPLDLSVAAARGCIGFGVRKGARALGQLYDAVLAPVGIKGTQFSLLNAVHLMQAPGIQQLAQALVMDRTTLTRNLRPLVDQGLLEVRPGIDRRERRVLLTQAGQERLAQALTRWAAVQEQLATSFGEERMRRLLDDLKELVQMVQED